MVTEKQLKEKLKDKDSKYKIQERYGEPPYGLSIRHDDVSPKPKGPLVCHLDIENKRIKGIFYNRIDSEKTAEDLTVRSLWAKGVPGYIIKNKKYKRITLIFQEPDKVNITELLDTIGLLKDHHSKRKRR